MKEFFDTKPELEAKCEKLAQMISKARHVIAFTGALDRTSQALSVRVGSEEGYPDPRRYRAGAV